MIINNVYLYKISRKGNYKSYKGDIYISNNVDNKVASFISNTGVKINCYYLEGKVWENSIWFEKDSQNLALKLLIKEAENKIKELQYRINGKQKRIDILKKMLEE